jgi:hypothetical protein
MTLVEVKTAELIGPALDWAVAKADGQLDRFGVCAPAGFKPSTDWNQGGPLIEEHQIWLTGPYRHRTEWKAGSGLATDWDYRKSEFEGPTPLIAAMRCLVASKLGDTVQVPKGLLP